MATPRAVVSEDGKDDSAVSARVRISDECLELDASSPAEVHTLRAWIGRVNGSTNIQPYLVERVPAVSVSTSAPRPAPANHEGIAVAMACD
jgi:hypothetical protein